MPINYLNSANLNRESTFPYLCMDIEKGKSVPEPPGFHVMHWHEDFQFIFVLTGEVYLHTLDQIKIIPAGHGGFLNKNVVHLVWASSNGHYKSILFPERLVSFYPGCPAAKYVKRIANCPQISCLQLAPAISWQAKMLEILVRLSHINPSSVDCYEYEVLSLLSNLWLELAQNLPVPEVRAYDIATQRMETFLYYIQQHYAEDMTLDDLARSAGVSKSECLRCFKLSIQDTPYHYLMEYRLQMAVDLLINSMLSIGEVAQVVGFQSQSHFGKLFKRRTGCSPRDFRARNKSSVPQNALRGQPQ